MSLVRHALFLSLALVAARTTPVRAQGMRLAGASVAPVVADDSIASALRAGVAQGTAVRFAEGHAVLWIAGGALTDEQAGAFAASVDRGLTRLSALLGRSLDRAHYDEDTLQLFIADGIGVSHVYGGYSHASHRRPYLYLDAARVRRGDAPYLHEATHILAWQFGSHSLREGIASWAEAVLIGEGVSSSTGLFGMGSRTVADRRARELVHDTALAHVVLAIGRAGMPDPGITSPASPRTRESYYVMSQSFASFLIEHIGIAGTLALHEAAGTDEAYQRTTGHPLERWRGDWLAALGRTP